ncbi:type VI secretion system tip protein VgrG [Massilia agilis]|uniref:Type VI secretion system tip protein VgrG n=1 Tax=Massilia agilis TaxID=1811226 RepID=A0ABT2DGL7_9BURK|nr:type VI secretion system tip protein VgrG [Massilia agilis]MCS0810466.1 type VI secretion system tip protein VgrG [Massilia agilis]
MPDSTAGGVVSYDIKVNGASIPGTYLVHAIHIEQAVNRIATATITVLDGDPSAENFAISASANFVPGNTISIELGYDGQDTVVFSGIVTKQAIRVINAMGPVLDIECKDQAVKMTVGRKSANFSKKTDSDVIQTLIGNAGLSAAVTATSNQLPTLVQYYVSDWDFMLSRAEVNGMLATTINNKVSVFDPTADTTSALTLTYGSNIFDFEAELNALTQLSQVKASAWDFQTQKLISAQAANTLAGPGNLSSKTLAGVVGLASYELQTTATETSAELTSWAKAQMLRSSLSKITGTVRFQGSTALVPGKYVTLDGLGARFDGAHFVSAVRHEVSQGNWVTQASIGMAPTWFAQENQVEAPSAAGLLPGIQGLYNATVQKIYEDEDNEYRILVEVALFNDNATGLWARLANFYSTNGQGVFFLPEVGDEVILGFLNQDPRYPVILGSMYSQKNKTYSAFTPNQKNSMKGIVSKSELRVMFDDENKILSLVTPAGNTLVLDDQGKQVELKDQNGNSIVMAQSGITIKSNGNITIEASQKVTIKGTTGIDVQSSGGDVSTSGLNIKETAQLQYAAKGSATAEVQGGATLTLKGAMVMIN